MSISPSSAPHSSAPDDLTALTTSLAPLAGGATSSARTIQTYLTSVAQLRRWQDRRDRLELLAQAFAKPIRLSPVVEPSASFALDMKDGHIEGIVLKDRRAPYRDGSRAGWSKVKARSWYEREAWRFDRRSFGAG